MERDMDAELRFHLEAFAEDLVRIGIPREEALRRARIELAALSAPKKNAATRAACDCSKLYFRTCATDCACSVRVQGSPPSL